MRCLCGCVWLGFRGCRYQPKGRPRSTDAAQVAARHHHLKALGGCGGATTASVQCAFERLYTRLLQALSSFTPSQMLLNRVLMRCWALHFTEQDHAFLQRVGIVPLLARIAGVESHVRLHEATLGSAMVAALSGAGGRGGAWREWDVDHVVYMLESGLLSKAEVALHAQAGAMARGATVPGALSGDAATVSSGALVGDVIAAYKDFSKNAAARARVANPPSCDVELAERAEFERRNQMQNCQALLSLLGVRCMVAVDPASPESSHQLAASVLEATLADLQAVVAHMEALHAGRAPTIALEPLVVERLGLDRLLFLLSVCTTPVVLERLVDARQLRMVFALLRVGSFRLQRAALRLLRVVLPEMSPDEAGAAVGEAESKDAESGPSVLSCLLDKLSTVVCPLGVAKNAPANNPAACPQPRGFGAGDVHFTLATETVALLRSLQHDAGKRWWFSINAAFRSTLNNLKEALAAPPPAVRDLWCGVVWCALLWCAVLRCLHFSCCVDTHHETVASFQDRAELEARRAVFARCAGVLWVLGGGSETLRPGAHVRVRVPSSGGSARVLGRSATGDGSALNQALASAMVQNVGEGVIVRVTRDKARVLFGRVGAAVPQDADVSTLLPVDEVAPCLHGIAATAPRVLKFLAVLDTAFSGVADDMALWRVEVKARAFGALRYMLQDLEFARYAVQADLLPTLFQAALVPVALPGFPEVERVEAQWQSAVARLIEASTGTHYCHEVKGGQQAAQAMRHAAESPIAQPAQVGVRTAAGLCVCACVRARRCPVLTASCVGRTRRCGKPSRSSRKRYIEPLRAVPARAVTRCLTVSRVLCRLSSMMARQRSCLPLATRKSRSSRLSPVPTLAQPRLPSCSKGLRRRR